MDDTLIMINKTGKWLVIRNAPSISHYGEFTTSSEALEKAKELAITDVEYTFYVVSVAHTVFAKIVATTVL